MCNFTWVMLWCIFLIKTNQLIDTIQLRACFDLGRRYDCSISPSSGIYPSICDWGRQWAHYGCSGHPRIRHLWVYHAFHLDAICWQFFVDQKEFVTVVRAVEAALGVEVSGFQANSQQTSTNASQAIIDMSNQNNTLFDSQVIDALINTAIILAQLASESGTQFDLGKSGKGQQPLVTKSVFKFCFKVIDFLRAPLYCSFMDVKWQNTDPPNPADAAMGPQAYDNHLYYS